MPLWLKTTLTVLALLSVVPLAVLANTSSPKAAWRASKEYLKYLAFIVVPGALFTLVYWLML